MLEALIKETACFSVILEDFIKKPSLSDYDRILEEWRNGQLSSKSARQYAFMELYVEAIDMANAIGFMVDNSLHKAGFILWRALYERLVICTFIFKYDSTCQPLSQNYVAHQILLSTIRHRENYNELIDHSGGERPYDSDDIEHCENLYKDRFGAFDDYAWAKPALSSGPTFKEMRKRVQDDMDIYYGIASRVVHPTIGHWFAALGASLPLPVIPMLPQDHVESINEMRLEYLTANALRKITIQLEEFVELDSTMQEGFMCLKESGDRIVNDLR